MVRVLAFAAALFLSILSAPAEAAECSALPAPYGGPLFDAMSQLHRKMPGGAAVREARAAGVSHMALFSRHQSGRGRSTRLIVLGLGESYPGFLIVGAPKVFDEDGDLDDGTVSWLLGEIEEHKHPFVGEILYTHADKVHGEQTYRGERYVDPLAPGTARLLKGLAGRRIPVMTHWEFYAWGRDWPRFDKLYADWPEQIFIIPHAGFGAPAQVDEILRKHRNIYVTLSKREERNGSFTDPEKAALQGPEVIDSCGAIRPEWRAVILAHQDRLLFATDAHKDFRWRIYGEIVGQWRAILGQIPAEAARKIAFDNAMALYGVAPKRQAATAP